MTPQDVSRSELFDSLRLTPKEHLAILDELDARNGKTRDLDRRHDERLRFTQQALLVVQIKHPGGSVGNFVVRTRNLSKTGLGFLHGAFVYPGTPCIVLLKNTKKAVVEVEGKVVRCQHVRANIHEVGLRFERPIRLKEFLGYDGSAAVPEERLSIPRLTGRVLCVDDSPIDQELMKFHLSNLGVTCDLAENGLDAVEAAESVKYDIVISALGLRGMTGFEVAEALRDSNYKGPIIAMTADEQDTTRIEALERGFTAVLRKPYRLEDLLAQLELHLQLAPAQDTKQVILSDLWGNQQMRPLIQKFVDRLREQVAEINRLSRVDGAAPLVERLCMDMKGSAGSYGFPQITHAATALLSVLDRPGTEEWSDHLRALVALCDAAVRGLGSSGEVPKQVA